MRVVFVWTGASESIGIEYLSSVLKKVGHQTSLVFDHNLFDDKRYLSIKWLAKLFNKRKKVVEDILRAKPELVMFSVFTYSYNWACSIAKELKRHSDVPVIFGGIHVSSVPDVVIKNDFVDMICIGEAEEAVVELAEALSEQKTYYHIKNLWFKDNGQIIKNDLRSLANDLDSRPFPDKKLFLTEFPIFNEYTIMTGRGCPYSCSFCFNSFYKEIYNGKGKYYRRRSVENVILELIDAKKKYKIKKVHFFDDIFTIDRPWLLKFLMQYKKKIKLPFQCLAHFDTVDRPLLVLLKKAGCTHIGFGLQSASEKIRKNILNRNESDAQINKIFSICESLEINYVVDYIFGLPYETTRSLNKAANLFSPLKYCRIDCFWLMYLPQTKIIEFAKEHKLLSEDDIKNINLGHEQLPWSFGSVKDRRLQKKFRQFEVFFKIMPIIPVWKRKIIVRLRAYLVFRWMPGWFVFPLYLLASLKAKNDDAWIYLKYYLFQLKRALFKI